VERDKGRGTWRHTAKLRDRYSLSSLDAYTSFADSEREQDALEQKTIDRQTDRQTDKQTD